ncbi:hypothetical protein BD769DRAFT_1399640 [Suillus cothurnatus]|nr:hypothetical protein BD769DRAFT_1399640 [Suillus cothurnatus]
MPFVGALYQGVINNPLPLIRHRYDSWDFAIGHGLGVDHKRTRTVNKLLRDDTLLIVLGNHEIDKMGHHGGDSVLETMCYGPPSPFQQIDPQPSIFSPIPI